MAGSGIMFMSLGGRLRGMGVYGSGSQACHHRVSAEPREEAARQVTGEDLGHEGKRAGKIGSSGNAGAWELHGVRVSRDMREFNYRN